MKHNTGFNAHSKDWQKELLDAPLLQGLNNLLNPYIVPINYFAKNKKKIDALKKRVLPLSSPIHDDPYQIKDANYFNQLSTCVLHKIHQLNLNKELTYANTHILTSYSKTELFQIPYHYFTNLINEILNKTRLYTSTQEELEIANALQIKNIKKENKSTYAIPSGYFNNLQHNIIQKIHSLDTPLKLVLPTTQSVQEELKENKAPILMNLKKENKNPFVTSKIMAQPLGIKIINFKENKKKNIIDNTYPIFKKQYILAKWSMYGMVALFSFALITTSLNTNWFKNRKKLYAGKENTKLEDIQVINYINNIKKK